VAPVDRKGARGVGADAASSHNGQRRTENHHRLKTNRREKAQEAQIQE